jgi:methylated-DNA-[protein]-cysteine S-methyltransferase
LKNNSSGISFTIAAKIYLMNQTTIKRTLFGPVVLIWTRINNHPTLTRILLSKPDLDAQQQCIKLYPKIVETTCDEILQIADKIQAILQGEPIPLDAVALNQCSPFQEQVLTIQQTIPFGCVTTYNEIATQLNVRGGARAVGNALARNPFPVLIPCHRAIRSNGTLGGYQGGPEMKQALLELEGICVDANGKVRSVGACREKSDHPVIDRGIN